MTDVLMVVVSYNNMDLTMRAVRSLKEQTEEVRVLVWDNASVDGTVAWLERNKIEHVASERNVLWSPAVNAGLQYRENETYVGFMNNDISLPPDAIKRMTDLLKSDEKIGMVAPMGAALGGPQDWATHHGNWTMLSPTVEELQDLLKGRPPKRATYVVGACTLLPHKVWAEVGPLDEEMPLGADDHDYSIRVKQAGYQIWVNEDVYASHYGHASGHSENWGIWGPKSWDRFNTKWANYYKTEEEAIKSHWGGEYHEGYDR
jgi:GT2 family glycosyltransferase